MNFSNHESKQRARRTFLMTSTLLASVLGNAGMLGAVAQDEETVSRRGGDEIIVSATKRDESVQDISISVTVADGEEISREGIRDLEGLRTRLSAVNVSKAGPADLISIRGVGSGVNAGFEQSVGTFVDGVYRGRSRFARSNFVDLERVEVLKGPQSTFFGYNTIAGALNISTKRPGYEREGYLSALYAPDHEEVDIQGGLTLPLSDNLAVRGAFRYYDFGGYITNVAQDRNEPSYQDIFGRISVLWEPTSTLTANLRVEAGSSDADSAFPLELGDCPPDPARFSAPTSPTSPCARSLASDPNFSGDFDNITTTDSATFDEGDFYEVALTLDWDVADHTVTSVTAYSGFELDQLLDVDSTAAPGFAMTSSGPGPSLALRNFEEFSQFSQELRVASPTGQFLEYLAGVYFHDNEITQANDFGIFAIPVFNPPPLQSALSMGDAVVSVVDNIQEEQTFSFYVAPTLNITDRFRINAGIRYTKVEKDILRNSSFQLTSDPFSMDRSALQDTLSPQVQGTISSIFGTAPILNGFELSLDEDDWTPSAGIEYDVTDDILAYAKYSDGFKAGGFDFSRTVFIDTNMNNIPDTDVELDPFSFSAETVNSYEIGIKSQWLDGALTANVALFRSAYTDLQQSTILPDGINFAVLNAGEAVSQGVEVETRFFASDYITLGANMTYLDSTFDSFPGAAVTAQQAADGLTVQDLSGEVTPFSPEFSGNFYAQIEVPVGQFVVRATPNIFVSTSYFQQADLDPGVEQEGFEKIDLRLSVGPREGVWEIAMVAKNLTDSDTFNFLNDSPGSTGSLVGQRDRPRSFAVQGRLTF